MSASPLEAIEVPYFRLPSPGCTPLNPKNSTVHSPSRADPVCLREEPCEAASFAKSPRAGRAADSIGAES